MKKIIFVLICSIFLISLTSAAWEWDNIKSYDKENREVTITNALGLGEDISKIKLNTPNVFYVIRGEDRLVAEFTINNFDTYSDVFNDMEFYDIKSGMHRFEREFTYKYKEFYEVEIIDYEIICKERLTINGSIEKYNCHKEEIGEHTEQKFKWKVLNKNADIEKGNITIGIFTDVYANEIVEWIPTLYGVKIDEWAVWTESLNVGLVNYYTFNETSGTIAVDSLGNNNITFTGGELWNVSGVIGGKITFNGSTTGQTVSNLDSLLTGTNARTINFWGSISNNAATTFMLSHGSSGTQNTYSFGHTVANEYLEYIPLSEVYPQVNLNLVKMYTLIYDGTRTLIYVNGTLKINQTRALDTTQSKLRIGAKFDNSQNIIQGSSMDELGMWNRSLTNAEVTQLYNDGNGITYIPIFDNPPTVTLNSPTNNSNFTVNSVVFNCSSEDDDLEPTDSILNVSLLIDGVINFTLLNSTASQQNISLQKNITSISDGDYNWTCTSADSNDNVGTTVTRLFSIDSTLPLINVTSPRGIINFHSSGTNLTLNWTVSDINLDSCWFIYNETNISVTCSDNSTQFNITNINNVNLTFYANDTFGNEHSNFTNWSYKLFANSINFNTTTYETTTESFFINISSDGTQTVTANFFYNDIDKGATTKTGNDNEMEFAKTIQIPIGTGTKIFYFAINYGSELINSTFINQTVDVTNLTLCETTPQNISYINFTFKNETTNQEDINVTIISTWTYWLGDGTINKSLSFSNTTENPSYAFCFSPQDKTLKTVLELAYNNGESQQRLFNPILLLTNATTNQVLYLLPTSSGLFSPFSTVRANGDPIADVKGTITRVLEGSTITVASDFTDSSGFVSYFLNPDVSYSAVFSKSGFIDNVFSFIPTADLRTIIMGGGIVDIGNGTQILTNTTYTITPTNNTLQNNSNVLFGFNVTSSQTITLISMNITNSSGSQLNFTNNAGTGFISVNVNTGNLSKIIGYYIIQTSEETISVSKVWIVGTEFIGEYSLFNQLTLFNRYDFKDFMRILIILATILGTLIFMSSKEIIDTSESKVIVGILLIWGFSLVGWLDTGLIVNSAEENINTLGQLSNQFGIAILSTAVGVFFIFRRVFIRKI